MSLARLVNLLRLDDFVELYITLLITHSGALKDVEDEFANENDFQEDDEIEESPPNKVSKEDFCCCRSMCLRKPYCKCKAKSMLCKEACHPTNKKCSNK